MEKKKVVGKLSWKLAAALRETFQDKKKQSKGKISLVYKSFEKVLKAQTAGDNFGENLWKKMAGSEGKTASAVKKALTEDGILKNKIKLNDFVEELSTQITLKSRHWASLKSKDTNQYC